MYMNKLHMKATVAVVCLPRETVDNARLSTKVAVDEVNDVLVHFLGFLGNHGILQVGTVEALCEPKGERKGVGGKNGRGRKERREERGRRGRVGGEGERDEERGQGRERRGEGEVEGGERGLGCDQE